MVGQTAAAWIAAKGANNKQHLRLSETSGTAAVDAKGTSNGVYTGGYTLNQATTNAVDASDKSVLFNGTTGYVAIPHVAGMNVGDVFSRVYKLKRTAISAITYQILSSKDTGSDVVLIEDNNTIKVAKHGTGIMVTSTVGITDTNPHTLIVTKNGATSLKVWLDKVDVTGTVTNQTIIDTSAPLHLGTESSSPAQHYNGILDEYASFNIVLTAGEVADLTNLFVLGPHTAGTASIGTITSTTIDVSVTSATGGTAPYTNQLQVAPDVAGSPGTYVNNGSPSAGLSFSATGLTPGTTYWFRFITLDSAGVSQTDTSNAVSDTTTGVGADFPIVTSGPSIAGRLTTQSFASISWTTDFACVGQAIYGNIDPSLPGAYADATELTTVPDTAHTAIIPLVDGQTTYWAVRSVGGSPDFLATETPGEPPIFYAAALAAPPPTSFASSGGRGCFTNDSERLVYIRPDGVRYTLHAPPWRVVLSEEGFGTPPLEYVTDRAPFQNGDNVRAVFLAPRPIQLVVAHNFMNRGEYWDGRAALLDAFQPRNGVVGPTPGKLLYYLPGKQRRQLDVLLDSGPGFTPSPGGWREWSFTEAIRFTAHDPAWYDPTPSISTLIFGVAQSQLVFPITFPISFSDTSDTSEVTYTGSWPDYPSITVYGPVTGFSIENLTTGDKIQLNGVIAAGEIVTINLRGIKTITSSSGANVMSQLTADSDLGTFSLMPAPDAPGGVNQIRVTGSGTDAQSFVSLSWYKRYFGI